MILKGNGKIAIRQDLCRPHGTLHILEAGFILFGEIGIKNIVEAVVEGEIEIIAVQFKGEAGNGPGDKIPLLVVGRQIDIVVVFFPQGKARRDIDTPPGDAGERESKQASQDTRANKYRPLQNCPPQ